MPNPKAVNREEARMLVASAGYEQASAKTGIKAATLRQWARRFNWNKPMIHAQSKTVTTVTTPADALATLLQEDSNATKAGFSTAARKAAQHFAKLSPTGRKDRAQAAKNWISGAAQIHNWQQEEEGSGTLSGLRVYSKQTVIQVDQRKSAE